MTPLENRAAEHLLTWLSLRQAVCEPVDAVIGFGHFDLRIVDQCAALAHRDRVPWIVFCGGIGAGSADLGRPEADAFFDYCRQHYDIPAAQILTENRSTNTAENIRGVMELRGGCPTLSLRRVLLVANPSRQTRVSLTWRHLVQGSEGVSSPPATTLAEEVTLFRAHGQDLVAQLVGEVDRLVDYPGRGWIAPIEVPASVRTAAEELRPLVIR